MAYESERWDAERVRHGEQRQQIAERVGFVTAAQAADGSLVANTDVVFPALNRGRAIQGATLVLPAVNKLLGYQPVETLYEMQRQLSASPSIPANS